MNNSIFKKSSINEMCKQIKSAPVVFKKNDGTRCLAFYNSDTYVNATKLYIMFPDSNIPKYIEGNDLNSLRGSILHGIPVETATDLYNLVNKLHKDDTRNLIKNLIDKAPRLNTGAEVVLSDRIHHVSYSFKHACAWVYKGVVPYYCFVRDLSDNHASEMITMGNKIEYDVTFSRVVWAARISSKEYMALKKTRQEMYA